MTITMNMIADASKTINSSLLKEAGIMLINGHTNEAEKLYNMVMVSENFAAERFLKVSEYIELKPESVIDRKKSKRGIDLIVVNIDGDIKTYEFSNICNTCAYVKASELSQKSDEEEMTCEKFNGEKFAKYEGLAC